MKIIFFTLRVILVDLLATFTLSIYYLTYSISDCRLKSCQQLFIVWAIICKTTHYSSKLVGHACMNDAHVRHVRCLWSVTCQWWVMLTLGNPVLSMFAILWATPVQLHKIANSQLANHTAAAQCTFRPVAAAKFKLSVRMRKKKRFEWLWTWCACLSDELVSVFHKL